MHKALFRFTIKSTNKREFNLSLWFLGLCVSLKTCGWAVCLMIYRSTWAVIWTVAISGSIPQVRRLSVESGNMHCKWIFTMPSQGDFRPFHFPRLIPLDTWKISFSPFHLYHSHLSFPQLCLTFSSGPCDKFKISIIIFWLGVYFLGLPDCPIPHPT